MLSVFESIFSTIPAFAYRCRNDKTYTMEFMEGAVTELTGYGVDDILGNSKVSYVGLTHLDDVDRVFADVDAAIEARKPWDVAYRLTSSGGDLVHVRERGCAVYKDGELAYLQGLVVGAEQEQLLQDQMKAHLEKSEAKNKEILDLIGQITASLKQLNMLSINARIEAARSGQAGLGFAVVADEIKALSDQNSNWANVIATSLKSDAA